MSTITTVTLDYEEHALIEDKETEPRCNKSVAMCKKCSLKNTCYKDETTCRNLCEILGGTPRHRFQII